MFKPGLISRIALLVIGIEIVAFGTLGGLYVQRYNTAELERVYARLRLVGDMVAGEELPISTLSRSALLERMAGAPCLTSLVVGGSGRVIVSSEPAFLGRPAEEVPGFDGRWLAAAAPEEMFVSGDDTLTSVRQIRGRSGGAVLYTLAMTISTAQINAERRRIVTWGALASVLAILLSSALIVLIAQRFVARRVEDSLAVLKAVEDGNLGARIGVSSQDELGQLQSGINSMTAKVGDLLDQLRERKKLLQSVLEHAPVRIFWKDRESRFLGCNTQFAQDAGLSSPADLVGKSDYELSWREQAEIYRADDRAVMESGNPKFDIVEPQTQADGHTIWLSTSKVPMRDEAGQVIGILGIYSDITARKQAEAELQLYATAFSHSGEANLICDGDNKILSINLAFTRMTGYSIDDIRGKDPSVLSSGLTPPQTYREMWSELEHSDYWQGELIDRRKDGSTFPKWISISAIRNAAGQVTHYVASFVDISDRKAAENRISYLAHHDTLTGVLNRFSLQDRLAQALATVRRGRQMLAVMFIDLDRFKSINDTFGHAAGDALLVEVAQRLRESTRDSDIVARLGGDEFVLVLTEVDSALATSRVAEKIYASLCRPYSVDGTQLTSTPSIGLALYPADGEDGETLMKNADAAMYHAKAQGRNNIQYFTEAMNQITAERLALERDLRAALDGGQIEVHYQPQVCTFDGAVCGVEALARWTHPERGPIPPAKFIPVAEESGLIEQLGQHVLDEACRQAAAWRAEGHRVRVAVNLSAYQLRRSDLWQSVQAALTRHALPGDSLELEITESVAMQDPQHAIEQMRALRELGVHLSIDDFGTGYSSLAYLKMLPIQNLKLDRTFVKDIDTDPNDAAICTATLALAHSLGLKVIAEGVENESQRDFLAHHRCDYLQGYLFGRPEPAAELSRRWRAAPHLLAGK